MEREYSESLLATVRSVAPIDPSHPQAILHDVYSAIIGGDYDAFGEAVTDDVELNIIGFAPMHGTWRGRKEVVEATRRNLACCPASSPKSKA